MERVTQTLVLPGVGRTILWFSDVMQFFAMKDNPQFASILSKVSCVMTIGTILI